MGTYGSVILKYFGIEDFRNFITFIDFCQAKYSSPGDNVLSII